MQSHSRAHHSPQPLHWDPASVAITILVTLLFIFFLFVFLTLTATPAQGQNHVPATAAQAAKMPQFASKLGHPHRMARPDNASRLPSQQHASYRNPNDPRARYRRSGPLDSNDMYDNGPTNGTVDAWTINFGSVVSDSFPVPQQNSANGMNFVAWLFPGDLLQSVEISITSSEFGGTTYFDGVVNLTQSNCTTNQLGFSLCTEAALPRRRPQQRHLLGEPPECSREQRRPRLLGRELRPIYGLTELHWDNSVRVIHDPGRGNDHYDHVVPTADSLLRATGQFICHSRLH